MEISHTAFCRAAIASVLILASAHAAAHGGGLDARGCHHDRRHGGYHCHRSPAQQVSARYRAALETTRTRAAQAVAYGRQQALNARSDLVSTYSSMAQGLRQFRSCSEARLAGFRRMRAGDAGYSLHLNRDRDGVACE